MGGKFSCTFLLILLFILNTYSVITQPGSDDAFLESYLRDATEDHLSGKHALRLEEERTNQAAQAPAPSPTGTAAGLVTRVLIPNLDAKGLPTPQGLLSWLKKANILNATDQFRVALLKAGEDRPASGSKALRVFIVHKGDRPVLIIKVLRDRAAALDEARLISKAQTNKRVMGTQSIFDR